MRYGISLGSNIGSRAAALRSGIHQLLQQDATARVIKVASLYESAPVDCPEGSPAFYNSVVELHSDLAPESLLALTQGIEQAAGRVAVRERNAPRPLDLDLLYAGQTVLHTPALTLPHPRMTQRRFVMLPLAEIQPQLRLPGWSHTAHEYAHTMSAEEQPLQRVAGPDWLHSTSL